jgi:AcrR family transcriptional regulator
MTTAYEQGGRTRQKQRTRTALVTAAQALVAAGVTPTVEQAAEAAGISRTTAYRYFPSHAALLAAAHPETGAASLLPPNPPADPAARLDLVVHAFIELILDTETQQRTMLRLALDNVADLPLRQGRAIAWIEEALAPLHGHLSEAEIHMTALAVRSAAGIEALVWLTDVAKLSRPQAAALMRWSAAAVLQAARSGRPPLGPI